MPKIEKSRKFGKSNLRLKEPVNPKVVQPSEEISEDGVDNTGIKDNLSKRSKRIEKREKWLMKIKQLNDKNNKMKNRQYEKVNKPTLFNMSDIGNNLISIIDEINAIESEVNHADINSTIPLPIQKKILKEMKARKTPKSLKSRRKTGLEQMKRMHEVMTDTNFQRNPLATIKQHVKISVEQELIHTKNLEKIQ